jgi:translation initiation factor 1
VSRKSRIRTDGAPPLSANPFAVLEGAFGDLPLGDVEDTAPPPAQADASPPRPGEKIVLRREKKGRGGKTATIIEGLQRSDDALQAMARELRRSLGCGAHVEAMTIVVSGAQTERVRDWLAARGATRLVIGN